MRALFYSNRGSISLGHLEEAPAEFPAFAHSPYVRTGIDTKRGLVVYEQQPELLRSLLAAYRARVAESESEYICTGLMEALAKCRK